MRTDSLTSYHRSNIYLNKQTFGKLIIGERTMGKVNRLVGSANAESGQTIEKNYRYNLKNILGYYNATPDKKQLLDSIFAKMPKEEVDDLTLYCKTSNPPPRITALIVLSI